MKYSDLVEKYISNIPKYRLYRVSPVGEDTYKILFEDKIFHARRGGVSQFILNASNAHYNSKIEWDAYKISSLSDLYYRMRIDGEV